MGKTLTPRYRVITFDVTGHQSIFCWWVKEPYCKTGYGKPNTTNLQKFVDSMNRSFLPGGSNEHISKHLEIIPNIYKAKIETNDRQPETICIYVAPSFLKG